MQKVEFPWVDGGFARDTMIFAVGRLAERLLQTVFDSPHERRRYARAFQHSGFGPVEHNEVLTLFERGRGVVRVRVRPAFGEFFFCAQHPHFRLLAPLGYDADARRVSGLWVAGFEGSQVRAVRFFNESMAPKAPMDEVQWN
ncbi:MAG: hypothetical protein AAF411_00700 [Myxococcota bacterium]